MIISMICASVKSATGAGGDVAAVAQDGQAVAEGAHLRHAVGDEDDGGARRLQPRDDLAEPVDVAAGERRGRLVEQQDARLAVDGARDLDLLLQGEIELADLVVEIDGEAERVEMAADRIARRRAPDHAGRRRRRVGQQHVVEDGQIGDQGHLLERRLDAERVRGARRAEPTPRRRPGNDPRVGLGPVRTAA